MNLLTNMMKSSTRSLATALFLCMIAAASVTCVVAAPGIVQMVHPAPLDKSRFLRRACRFVSPRRALAFLIMMCSAWADFCATSLPASAAVSHILSRYVASSEMILAAGLS